MKLLVRQDIQQVVGVHLRRIHGGGGAGDDVQKYMPAELGAVG